MENTCRSIGLATVVSTVSNNFLHKQVQIIMEEKDIAAPKTSTILSFNIYISIKYLQQMALSRS